MARGRLRQSRLLLPLVTVAAASILARYAERAEAQRPPFSNLVIRQALAGNLSAEDKKTLDTYFDGFFFKRFRQPQGTEDLPNLRALYKNLVRNIPKSPSHDYLNGLVLKRCKGLLGVKNATIRYNAMLLVAELNESDKNPIKPMPEAFTLLMQVINLKGRPDLDFLKAAALVGLTRIADERAIPTRSAGQVSAAMLALATQKDPPPGSSNSAHKYMRRNAARVLALMGNPGPNGEVLAAFESMLTDPQSSVMTKCEMARFIGMLRYPPAAKVDLQRLANLLGHQAATLCASEVGSGDKAPDKGPEKVASKRYIMYVLESSDTGLQGLYEAAERGSDQQKFIYELKDVVASLLKTLADLDETKEAEVASIVRPQIDKLRSMLTANGDSGAMVAGVPRD